MQSKFKVIVVVVGAIGLSTLALQASDLVRGIEASLVGSVGSSGPCAAGSSLMQFGGHAVCIDNFEASAGAGCPVTNPTNLTQSEENVATATCLPTSEANRTPWRFVSLTQAQQLCARAGKRLPSNDEWYKTALTLSDESPCATDVGNGPVPTGSSACATPAGVHDMIGNVWEWIDGQVSDGSYEGRVMPEAGYVSLAGADGVVVETADSANAEYGADYAWTNTDGVRGMIRGGFWGSGEDAGVYALNAAVPLDFKTTGVGFRCVKDLY